MMPRYTIAYAKNIMRRAIRAIIDAEPTRYEIATIWEYFKGECAYCGRKLTRQSKEGHIDHLVSAALRGGNELANRVLSCGPCNGNEKRDMPWEDFLRLKNPDKRLFEARRRAILHWQERVATGKVPRKASKDEVDRLAAAEASVQDFEKACLALRETIQKT
jgi:hypothetical protein